MPEKLHEAENKIVLDKEVIRRDIENAFCNDPEIKGLFTEKDIDKMLEHFESYFLKKEVIDVWEIGWKNRRDSFLAQWWVDQYFRGIHILNFFDPDWPLTEKDLRKQMEEAYEDEKDINIDEVIFEFR